VLKSIFKNKDCFLEYIMKKKKPFSNFKLTFLKNYKDYIYFITGVVISFALIYMILTSFLIEPWFRRNVVYVQIGPLPLYFFTLSMAIFLFVLMLSYRAIKYGLTSLIFLIIGLSSAAISYLFGCLNWNPGGTIPQTGIFEIQLLTSTLSIYFLFFHFELNDRESPRSGLTILITLCLLPYCLKNLYSLVSLNYGTNTGFQLFLRTLVQIGAIVIFFSVLLIGLRLSRAFFAHSPRARILGGFQFAGIVLLFINILFEFLEGILEVFRINFSAYNTPIFVISIILISGPQFIDPELLGLVPPNVQVLTLIDDRGITHYYEPISEEFRKIDEENLSSQLIGGLTLAFANVSERVAKSKAGIDSLKFGDRAMIVEFLEPYYLVVIAERDTYFLHLEMKQYIHELKELYKEPPQDSSLIPERIFRQLNRDFFPILTPSYFTK
jgi:hypothetical protein